jgi:hypothetical protein
VSGKSAGNSRNRERSKERASLSRNGANGDATSGSSRADASAPAPNAGTSRKAATEDIALVCGLSEDGQGVEIIRKRGDRIESGTVRRLEAGKPIHGEIVRLRPRPQAPMVCDVEVEFGGTEQAAGQRTDVGVSPGVSSGPAQVATDSYRKNWDAVYGRSRKPSLLN